MVEYAEAVTEELEEADSSGIVPDESEPQKGGQPKPASLEKVSERTGVSARTAHRAAVHVETADGFPFMQPWPQ